ncbi:DEAD/DEAH box helicase [Candidatus Thiodiazotropha endoloripes]|uniref:DEAD/DEAH box helicase n=1 Tax=Candidatus Thiodiazotropha endoloripes TaxID=1818881 RepID=UPI00083D35C8|nr:DEAD/DEAH box helicase [Candidatus Thiodiazotropha endoloripes]ODB85678.1 DEAD/DEAH box helicase [Candidatus Thiodiazotropha endoloripes]
MSDSQAFSLLDVRIQKWIWEAGWSELRDAQERAVAPILAGDKDVIIAAATAAGKTEAALLPILTRMLREKTPGCTLYISPLKALINDQWDRLDRLCGSLEIPVIPWHGDISTSKKKRFLKEPCGILLITPESLEALLMNHGHGLAGIFSELRYVVVDELHAFLGTERGKQLQSLMHRVEFALKRQVPRIGLSATLGDMGLTATYLRFNKDEDSFEMNIIVLKDSTQELRAQVKGYVTLPPQLSELEIHTKQEAGHEISLEETLSPAILKVANHLYSNLRGQNNLIFPNSRTQVELYADLLRRQSERNKVPNEFWPHHGSLSKEIRSEAETALKQKERPASAVATTTLELGIDIGAVKSIAQIGPAPSVASLRQRLGRSGRRKCEPAVLRCYCLESALDPQSPISDRLHEGLVQSIAQIRLLVNSWFEPPMVHGLHLSTLVQQLLSVIAQYGGLTAAMAWQLLCNSGPFQEITQTQFAQLLRALGERDVLTQESSGLLLHGSLGEKLINHYSFYATFTSEEEFRLITEGKPLGSLPITRPLELNSLLIFAGHRWRVIQIDPVAKDIEVLPDKGGKPPEFDGLGSKVHDRVREEMRQVLLEHHSLPFIDQTAGKLLDEARQSFLQLQLDHEVVIQNGGDVRLFTWKGDWVMDTLQLALSLKGLKVINEGLCLLIRETTVSQISDLLFDMSQGAFPSESELTKVVLNKHEAKWDWLLPESLLAKNYSSHNLNISATKQYLQQLIEQGIFAAYL